jgi:phosphoglucomutase
MEIKTISTTPFSAQKTGTAGLRKKVTVYEQKNYLENFIQSVFNAVSGFEGKTIILGGDGRYYNAHAIQVIAKMAIAQKVGRIIIGQNGLFSTPAASNLIIRRKAFGGFILSASHNPGGKNGDFGIKFDLSNGGGAPENVTNRIYEETKKISSYKIAETPDIDISQIGEYTVGETVIEIVDSIKDYVDFVQGIFDFDALKKLVSSENFKMRYDAMNGSTGPYATRIFEEILGAPKGTVLRKTPLEDFGGGHPDPNLTYAKELVDLMYSDENIDFGCAADGDGDRNMILGSHFFVTPSDSLAILTANYEKVPYYRGKVKGVARSMPTSRALDDVTKALGLTSYETPTGWKYFGSLMDAGLISFCGEESFGTGCSDLREKDGIWAILYWLSILASTGKTVREIVQDHWKTYGRHYYLRYDYETLETQDALDFMDYLRSQFGKITKVGNETVQKFEEWNYTDPSTRETALNQGIILMFESGSRIVFRLSGTGSSGKTLRIYLEKYEKEASRLNEEPQEVIKPLFEGMAKAFSLKERLHREYPTVIT